jgi:hypothetical protein
MTTGMEAFLPLVLIGAVLVLRRLNWVILVQSSVKSESTNEASGLSSSFQILALRSALLWPAPS